MDQNANQHRPQSNQMMMASSSDGSCELSTPIAQQNQDNQRIQLPDNDIKLHDVLCGRGKDSFNHPGNKRFRETITMSLESYRNADTRVEKSLIVMSIFDGIRTKGGRFLKRDGTTGRLFELSDQQSREKIAHAVRDAVNSMQSRREGKKIIAPRPKRSQTSHVAAMMNSHEMSRVTSNPYLPEPIGNRQNMGGFYATLESTTRDLRSRQYHYENKGIDAIAGNLPSAPTRSTLPFNEQPNLPYAPSTGPFGYPTEYQPPLHASQTQQSHEKVPTRMYRSFPQSRSSDDSILMGHESEGHYSTSSAHQNRGGDVDYSQGRIMQPAYLNWREGRNNNNNNNNTSFNSVGDTGRFQEEEQTPIPMDQQRYIMPQADPFLDRINEVLGPFADQHDTDGGGMQSVPEPRRLPPKKDKSN